MMNISEQVISEKKNFLVVFKTNGIVGFENHEALKFAKAKTIEVASEFNISLSMSHEIDLNLPLKDDDVAIEYYSKPKPHESISSGFLDFLDRFLDIGHQGKINTFPMD
jgi:hypothetical protein